MNDVNVNMEMYKNYEKLSRFPTFSPLFETVIRTLKNMVKNGIKKCRCPHFLILNNTTFFNLAYVLKIIIKQHSVHMPKHHKSLYFMGGCYILKEGVGFHSYHHLYRLSYNKTMPI